jgi:hypothetical protein
MTAIYSVISTSSSNSRRRKRKRDIKLTRTKLPELQTVSCFFPLRYEEISHRLS